MDSFIASKKRVPMKLKTSLAHSFGFDLGDLQDNRSGFISHWQKSRLRWHLLSYTISILTWIFILTIFPLALITSVTFLVILWIGAVLVVFGMIWLWQLRSVFRDIQRGKVADLIAPVKHIREVRGSRKVNEKLGTYKPGDMDYFIKVDNERFITTKEQMESFKEEHLYHIYVAVESRQILSAELLGQDEINDMTDFFDEKVEIPDYLDNYDEPQYQEKEKP